jgi:hypothetical protein
VESNPTVPTVNQPVSSLSTQTDAPTGRSTSLRFRVALACVLAVAFGSAGHVAAQSSSSSSSSSSLPAKGTLQTGEGGHNPPPKIAPKMAQPEAGGAEITLETSEPLFDVTVAKNACGYDADLDRSVPVRAEVRADVERAIAESPKGVAARTALCDYLERHTLTDRGRDLGQYLSLALFLGPPPGLALTAPETDLPPDATQVVNVLAPLRTFGEAIDLHAIWLEHRAEYEAQVAALHEPLTRMILDTNIYLHLPVSSYSGRRFLVLMEPMIAPATTNTRVYGTDTAVIVSPSKTEKDAKPGSQVHMEDVRHAYLRYEIEPLVDARSGAMDRLLPLLKTVTEAPIDFVYKSDITALLTECMVKAVEAHTMDVGIAKPAVPVGDRPEQLKYVEAMTAYDRQAEAVRQARVQKDMSAGWVLTRYFYDEIGKMEHEHEGLKEDVAEMVYGMDIDGQVRQARKVVFTHGPVTGDLVRREPVRLSPLEQGEDMLAHGNSDGAEDLAQKALDDPKADHAAAHYLFARAALVDRLPDEAQRQFQEAVQSGGTPAANPRVVAWSHIYLGRLYDAETVPERDKAVAEYRAALAVDDCPPDARAAAQSGVEKPFANPRRPAAANEDAPLDPSGKAEKKAYVPPPPQQQ